MIVNQEDSFRIRFQQSDVTIMKSSAFISVVIPCYNQGRYLRDAVLSVQTQTHTNWECIIVNDGSTDDTAGTGMGLAAEDGRVIYHEQANQGLSAARNAGIERSRGDFLQLLDSDDLILPTKFEKQLAAIPDPSKPTVVYCDYFSSSIEGRPEPDPCGWHRNPRIDPQNPLKDLAVRWETECSIPPHCFLFHASFFREQGIRFDPRIPNHEDWDAWLRILALRPALVFVDEALAVYRFNPSSMTRNGPKMRAGFLRAIRKQRRIHRHHPEMLHALAEKEKSTRRRYASYSPWKPLFVLRNKVLWPVMRLCKSQRLRRWIGLQ